MCPKSETAELDGKARRLDQLSHGNTRDEYKAAHDAMRANDEIWQSLAFAGLQHDGLGQLGDLRHCPFCQSTLLRPISSADALSLAYVQAQLHARSIEAISDASRAPVVSGPSPRHRKATAKVLAACALLLALCPAGTSARRPHPAAPPDMLSASCRDRDPESDERMRKAWESEDQRSVTRQFGKPLRADGLEGLSIGGGTPASAAGAMSSAAIWRYGRWILPLSVVEGLVVLALVFGQRRRRRASLLRRADELRLRPLEALT